METLVEEGKGPKPGQIDRWIDLLKLSLKEGGE